MTASRRQTVNAQRYAFVHAVLLALATSGTALADMRFTDQTVSAGVEFVHGQSVDHRSGPMGGGGAVGDFNSDGFPDLFVIGGGNATDALFINNGDGTFIDRAGDWGLASRYRGTGATVGDFDGDGDDDIYVTSMGDSDQLLPSAGHHRLYRNEGGYFVNVAAAAGVNRTADYPDGYGAAFGDYDLDGDLDLFVAGWHSIGAGDSFGSRLFRNRGDATFEDVTAEAGVLQSSTHAFGAIFADMDGDRWPEMLVAGDFGTSRYYRNNRDGTFTEIDPGTSEPPELSTDPNWSIGKAHNGMGAVVADLDGDRRPDWFITAIWPAFHFESPYPGNGLYLNRGGHHFDERTQVLGLADGGWGWGVAAADFDHDGRLDVLMTNGWPNQDQVTGESFDEEPSYLFMQQQDGSFRDEAQESGLSHTLQGRGLLTLDYDRDGDLDVIILSNRDGLRLYRNETIDKSRRRARKAHWLQLSLDTSRRPDLAPGGLGAQITVRAAKGKQRAWVTGGGTYLAASQRVTHFGLGKSRRVRAVVVKWPDGSRTKLRNVRANQHMTVYPPARRVSLSVSDGREERPL